MAILAELVDHVIGVDPDRDRVTAAVVCAKTQGELASKTFPATRRGYGQTLRWAQTQTVDDRRAWAIESTGSYGAGLAIVLAEKGEFVIEFDHPAPSPPKTARSPIRSMRSGQLARPSAERRGRPPVHEDYERD